MEEIEKEKDREKVLLPVRKHEQKAEQEQAEKTQEPEKQKEAPRRWRTY
ncbi:hypothetical protein ACFLW0_04790 [Chloroflexota bacterium]